MNFILPYGHHRHADPVPGSPALGLDSISAGYPGAAANALSNVSLEVPVGSRVALVGPNGSGKSTLLKVVAGLLKPTGGKVSIFGNPVGACHHRVAYLPQRSELDWRFPVNVERLVMGGRFVHLGWLRRPSRKDYETVREVLLRLGLENLAKRQIGELSGGQQQRALLARTLVQNAELLLLDEPTTAVDAETRKRISRVTEELHFSGKTVITATHDLDDLPKSFDEAILLREGSRLAADAGTFP